jgi:hypothetical protein
LLASRAVPAVPPLLDCCPAEPPDGVAFRPAEPLLPRGSFFEERSHATASAVKQTTADVRRSTRARRGELIGLMEARLLA